MRILGTDDPDRIEAARARLTILGSRAAPALIEALEDGCAGLRTNAISILSLIRDPRAREPIIAQLHDRDPATREAAAGALSRFPCQQAVAPLERTLRCDASLEVRRAAIRSLVALFEAGFEEAVREVVALLFERAAARRLRLEALAVVPLLRPRERRGVLGRLGTDPDGEFAEAVRQLERSSRPSGSEDPRAIGAALRALASDRPERWNEALHRLAGFGPAVIEPLVAEMLRRGRDGEYCARAGMVLRGLGPRRLRPIADYLDRVEEPIPLEIIVDVVGGLQDKPLTYRLRDLIERLKTRGAERSNGRPADEFDRVRAKAHLHLARAGSRVAIGDLRDLLSSPGRRIHLEILSALDLIGNRDDLFDLLRAWRKEEGWMRTRIGEVFRGIMRRERIRRTSRVFRTLPPADRPVLDQILAAPRRRAPRRDARRRAR